MSRILLVEDDAAGQTVIALALRRLGGHEVSICEDGDEVLRRARAGQADLIIMDVRLSNTQLAGQPTDGVRLARALKSEPATRAIPIVLVTAHAMRGDSERLLSASGADRYLSKPITDLAAFTELISGLMHET